MEIKNLAKTANRIIQAIKNRERIVLYGDSDPDGVSSVLIMEQTIKDLGGKKPIIYFPDRETEGYGLNEKALKLLRKYVPALLITLDCGITNAKEAEIAKRMGFDVIIVDHHEIPPCLPKAIIVNPKQKGDRYPFKYFATAGIAYKLSQATFRLKRKSFDQEHFLELVALATIADQMPLVGENKEVVEKGLLALRYTKSNGLKALMRLTGFSYDESSSVLARAGQFRQKLLPPLNIWRADRHINPLYAFLKETSFQKAQKKARCLLAEAEKKREMTRMIYNDAEQHVSSSHDSIIFAGSNSWPLIFMGPVASRLCAKYKKPVFLYKKAKEESAGGSRTPDGFDVVKAMAHCRKYLISYGGHPQAGGFRAKNKHLDKLKKCLDDYFTRRSPRGDSIIYKEAITEE